MHIRFLTTLALLGFCWNLAAQDKPQDKFLTAHSFDRPATLHAGYLLFLPKDYQRDGDKRWPLMLFLHGAGEAGTNVWRVDIHGPAKYIAEHPDFPFIVVSPQCPAEESWSNETLLALLDEISAHYQVDPDRVYLTGLSMGGYGAWSLALAQPERFAAVIPIAGGGSAIDPGLAALGYKPQRKAALKRLPIWAFHGAKDNVVPLSESEHMVEAMKKLGADEVKLTIYPEAGHNSWEQTYANPEVYTWLLDHKRPSAK